MNDTVPIARIATGLMRMLSSVSLPARKPFDKGRSLVWSRITRIMHRHTSIRATSGNKTDGRGLLL
jgi:hypothetical protein